MSKDSYFTGQQYKKIQICRTQSQSLMIGFTHGSRIAILGGVD